MTVTIGVDPGARHTGLVEVRDGHLETSVTIHAGPGSPLHVPSPLYVAQIVEWLTGRASDRVHIETVNVPRVYMRGQKQMISPASVMGACVVIGAVLAVRPGAVLVAPGGHGQLPDSMYPAALTVRGQKTARKHERSAWDIARSRTYQ